MHALHLAAERAPLAKVGGLGDVVGALPAALSALGVQSSVLMPLYGGVDGAVAGRAGTIQRVGGGEVRYGSDAFPYAVYRADHGGVPTYLLDEPVHFGAEGVYVGDDGLPFEKADTRFLVFQLAALDWLLGGAAAGAPAVDLLHLHDHHAGLVPVLLRHGRAYEPLADTPTLFTVHSADHQGKAPWAVWERVGVYVPEPEGLLVGEDLNAMKAALRWSDAVTTVSPTYAEELTTDDAMADGLADEFRLARPKLTGVLNGIDETVWSPSLDAHLPATYAASDLGGKAATKRAVCADLGLDPSRPLVAFVGRLMPEKGAEILAEGVERVLRTTDAAVAVLGTGDPEHEAEMRGLAARMEQEGRGDRLSVTLAFDNALAHRLYAAADLFLMPSRSEPCGLGQLYAMAYGTPPVVHAVGGLRDTVAPWDGAEGTGFAFDAFTPAALAEAVEQALGVHADREAYARLQQNAMRQDWSWARSAATYADLYRQLVSA